MENQEEEFLTGKIGSGPVEKYHDGMPAIAREYLAQGRTKHLVSIALGVSVDTLTEWNNPEGRYFKPHLSAAIKEGMELGQELFEALGKGLADGTVKGNALAWLFIMKNRHYKDFRDRRELEVEGSVSAVILDASDDEEPGDLKQG